jgi:type IV pilus assembly protein PilY1
MKTYVISTTETATTVSGVTKFGADLAWQKEFSETAGGTGHGGERVVGPMTLFDRVLYFSSVVPGSGSDCHLGYTSNIWGFDFLEADTSSSPRAPKADLLDLRRQSGAIQKSDIRDIPSLVAGVGLRQLPSCSTITTDVANVDAFLGYGKTTTIGASAPGSFQLVYQKNAGNQTGMTNGPPAPPVQTVDLAPPSSPVRVDSWAPIIE